MTPIAKVQGHSHPPKPRAGFTLVEVLIATLLFAIAAQGLVSIVVNTLSAIDSLHKDASQDSEQRFIIRQLMQIPDKETLEAGGDIQLPGEQTVEWRAEHETTNIVDLHKVTFELSRIESSQSGDDETLTLYLLRPWLSEPSERGALLDQKTSELESKEFRTR